MSKIFRDGISNAIKRLEDPNRINRHNPDILFPKVGLRTGMIVADLGCGTGFFALPASRIVGPNGMVYAVDFTPGILEVLKTKIQQSHITNVKVIESDILSTTIDAELVDLALLANVFHDVDKEAVLRECWRILKHSGELLVIDWKKADTGDGPPVELRMKEEDAIRIIQTNGWKVNDHFEAGPAHYAIIASKI